jgi:NAD(P)-dependent dehydrogenase (short-subunit alcohol dehydrogenase family)
MICKNILEFNLDGLVLTNTSVKLRENLINKQKNEKGGLSGSPIKDISNLIINKKANELLKEIKVNLINPHILVKKILPIMIKEKWGRFIFVGSSRALKTDVGISGYVAGKYASLGYSKSLSREYGCLGITSNYLSLGLFSTPLLNKLNKKLKKKLLDQTDSRSLGDYTSVINAINFIIKSNYITGSTISIYGGFN